MQTAADDMPASRFVRSLQRPMAPLARALVVDGDPIWRGVVERWLSAYGFTSIDVASSVASAINMLTGEEDLVVTEVIISHESCFGLVAEALRRPVAPAVVAMSDRAPRPYVFRLREAGVYAYLEKPFAAAALYGCLQQITTQTLSSSGRPGAPPESPRASLEQAVAERRARYGLTNAEVELLRCMLAGMRRIDVARERCTSVNTVKTQLRSLLSKSGAASVRELVQSVAHDMRSMGT